MTELSVGIIGLGYWGPNWLRNFAVTPGWRLVWGSDLSAERIAKLSRQYPAVRFTKHAEDLFADPSLDVVVIATPTSSHYALAKAALEAGKHVLVEKPMTETAKEAESLVTLARRKKRFLFVDHTFAFTEAVRKIEGIVRANVLGELLYFDSTRINLGIIQKDCNVLRDLAIHDLSILARIVDLRGVSEIFATGSKHYGTHTEDAHLHLTFRSGFAAHIHASWLSPVKVRKTFIAGRKAMVVYDDTEPSEKIRVYDKGVERDDTKPDPFFPKYRSGDVLIPALSVKEALGTEATHMLSCIRGEETPIVPGEEGAKVVRILELADRSLQTGKVIKISAAR